MLFQDHDPVSLLEANLYHYQRRFKPFPLPSTINLGHRWVVTSALQKSIRRGNVAMAYKAAMWLHRVNPNQVWNRLRVIACEDVGIGDLGAVFDTLYVSGKIKWRERNGGDEHVLAYIIERLCKAVKSRLADDILYTADVHADYDRHRSEFVEYGTDKLCDIALFDLDRNIFERMIALCYLHGTQRLRPAGMIENKGNASHVIDVFKQTGMPEHHISVIRLALSKTEGHAMSLGLGLLLQAEAKQTRIMKDDFAPSPIINGWPAEAYDKHTREGKQAFRKFLWNCQDVRDYLQTTLPHVDPITMIGWVVFAVEGQSLDQRITFPTCDNIRTKAQSTWLQCERMSARVETELLRLIRRHWQTLNDSRQHVMIKDIKLHSRAPEIVGGIDEERN